MAIAASCQALAPPADRMSALYAAIGAVGAVAVGVVCATGACAAAPEDTSGPPSVRLML